jgi:preprotein translocase subunit SecE
MLNKIQQFFKDVKVEMSKVSWPTVPELKSSTIVVVVVTIIFTLFIFLADIAISEIVKLFY